MGSIFNICLFLESSLKNEAQSKYFLTFRTLKPSKLGLMHHFLAKIDNFEITSLHHKHRMRSILLQLPCKNHLHERP